MEDDKLKELFADFNPELPSGDAFMSRLERSMDAVELVKNHCLRQRRHCRIAIVVAALVGVVVGSLLSALSPILCGVLSSALLNIPRIMNVTPEIGAQVITWGILASVSVVIACNTYELAMSKLSAAH